MSRSRHRHRKDKNQDGIVSKLSVEPRVSAHSTSNAGDGFPDLVIGCAGLTIIGKPSDIRKAIDAINDANIPNLKIHNGANLLIELKDGEASLSQQKLTDSQERWHSQWQGQHAVCNTLEKVKELLSPLLYVKK